MREIYIITADGVYIAKKMVYSFLCIKKQHLKVSHELYSYIMMKKDTNVNNELIQTRTNSGGVSSYQFVRVSCL